jgi:hypothetical protein
MNKDNYHVPLLEDILCSRRERSQKTQQENKNRKQDTENLKKKGEWLKFQEKQ